MARMTNISIVALCQINVSRSRIGQSNQCSFFSRFYIVYYSRYLRIQQFHQIDFQRMNKEKKGRPICIHRVDVESCETKQSSQT